MIYTEEHLREKGADERQSVPRSLGLTSPSARVNRHQPRHENVQKRPECSA